MHIGNWGTDEKNPYPLMVIWIAYFIVLSRDCASQELIRWIFAVHYICHPHEIGVHKFGTHCLRRVYLLQFAEKWMEIRSLCANCIISKTARVWQFEDSVECLTINCPLLPHTLTTKIFVIITIINAYTIHITHIVQFDL